MNVHVCFKFHDDRQRIAVATDDIYDAQLKITLDFNVIHNETHNNWNILSMSFKVSNDEIKF